MNDLYANDLHVHTFYSDGDLDQSPDTVCRQAAEAGIRYLSITDHDHVMEKKEIRALSMNNNIGLIPGCEFSGILRGKFGNPDKVIHIGGHYIDVDAPAVRQIIAHNQKQDFYGYTAQMFWNAKHICGLDPYGAGVEKNTQRIWEVHKESVHLGKRATTEPLVESGCVPTRKEAYKLFAPGGPCWVNPLDFLYFVAYEEEMEAVNASGLSTLNHAFLYDMGDAGTRDLFRYHKKLGGVGLETEYTPYDQIRRDILQVACAEYGFIPTAGSDRHDTSRDFIHGSGANFLLLRQCQLELRGTLNI